METVMQSFQTQLLHPWRHCTLFALLVFAAVSLLSPNAAIGSPISAEVLRTIPTSKLSDKEMVELFLSEEPYRWQSEVRIFVDYRQEVPSKYQDCINNYILERLKEDLRTKVVDYVVASDRGHANLLVQFDTSFREESCPSRMDDPAMRVVRDPPRAMTCIALLVHKSKIVKATVTVPTEALLDNLDLFQNIDRNFCSFPGLFSAISWRLYT